MACKVCNALAVTKANPDYCKACWKDVLQKRNSIAVKFKTKRVCRVCGLYLNRQQKKFCSKKCMYLDPEFDGKGRGSMTRTNGLQRKTTFPKKNWWVDWRGIYTKEQVAVMKKEKRPEHKVLS